MDIKTGCKIHNRFDIEVKDIKTGKIVQKGYAENIVLDSMYERLTDSSSTYFSKIAYGRGTGTLDPTRTSLFSEIGYKNASTVETVYNSPPLASYNKKKITILPSEAIGETITEVGIMQWNSNKLHTHALIKDAEGNPLSIGPKTDTQEITIYATVFAEITLPQGMLLTFYEGRNLLLNVLLGYENIFSEGLYSDVCSDKSPINVNSRLRANCLGYKVTDRFAKVDDRITRSPRVRFETSNGNGKVWSMSVSGARYANSSGAYKSEPLWQILFPNPMWPGYQFVGKSIGIGDGAKTKFVLPWSDINTDKEYKIYVDGALKTEGTDYTLANSETETSVTFTTAPAIDAQITGNWWVDYIPKDEEHVLDITFTIEFGEGA